MVWAKGWIAWIHEYMMDFSIMYSTSCIVPEPKVSKDYRSVVVSSNIMKTLEIPVLKYLRPLVQPDLDPSSLPTSPNVELKKSCRLVLWSEPRFLFASYTNISVMTVWLTIQTSMWTQHCCQSPDVLPSTSVMDFSKYKLVFNQIKTFCSSVCTVSVLTYCSNSEVKPAHMQLYFTIVYQYY